MPAMPPSVGAERHDDDGEFQVMPADLQRRIAERLELRDLLALQADRAA